MDRHELIVRLRRQRPLFDTEQVTSVALFGSRARADARPASDVDLLVEYRPGAKVSLLSICRLERLLAEELGLSVQVNTAPLRSERLRRSVERDRVDVL
jgi:hypothetical protein